MRKFKNRKFQLTGHIKQNLCHFAINTRIKAQKRHTNR